MWQSMHAPIHGLCSLGTALDVVRVDAFAQLEWGDRRYSMDVTNGVHSTSTAAGTRATTGRLVEPCSAHRAQPVCRPGTPSQGTGTAAVQRRVGLFVPVIAADFVSVILVIVIVVIVIVVIVFTIIQVLRAGRIGCYMQCAACGPSPILCTPPRVGYQRPLTRHTVRVPHPPRRLRALCKSQNQ